MARSELDGDTVERLRVALARVHRHLRLTSAGGLTPSQLSVLATLDRCGPHRAADLAAAERLNPTMLSRVLGRLTEEGYVRRGADADDGRAIRLQVTPAGRRLLARVRRERAAALRALVDGLDDTQRRALGAALPALEALGDGARPDPA